MQKRKILVIGAFTNGEEAAYKFIAKQGWKEKECELVFCGTNGAVIHQLGHGPAFAVVPVYNSIVGDIGEVHTALQAVREEGCVLHERGQCNLPISQCLMAPQFIRSIEEVREVISHKEALKQCRRYLDTVLKVPEARRYSCSSTGAAAEAVARLRSDGDERWAAAIAPHRAASHYGLRLLAENIQDERETYTTFVFFEHV